MVRQEAPLAVSQNQQYEARSRTRSYWDHIVHRDVDGHDYQLQEHLATAGHRGVETEHVAVEWANGTSCCHLDRWEPGLRCGVADENETGGVVGRALCSRNDCRHVRAYEPRCKNSRQDPASPRPNTHLLRYRRCLTHRQHPYHDDHLLEGRRVPREGCVDRLCRHFSALHRPERFLLRLVSWLDVG